MCIGIYAASRYNPLDRNIYSTSGLAREKRNFSLPVLYGFWKCEDGIFGKGEALNIGLMAAIICGMAGWFFFACVAAAVLGACAGFILAPRTYGNYRVMMRAAAVLKSLPGGTFSLLFVLRSGKSILEALVSAAENSSQPIAGEFLNMAREIRSGVKEEAAAENFGRRLVVREGRILGNVLARYIRLGGGEDSLELLEKIQGMLRNRDLVREAVRSGMSDVLGDATIALITTLGFFALGYLFMPGIYRNTFSSSAGRVVIFGGLLQAFLVQVWVRWKCRKMEEELM